ncbi:triphosphoribosyl-dephospho-CoA synthase [Collinsella tanakaei]|uniref:triphosphoribosyl-dephospho-CoA synthase n=1 Tax=Collinsella tanakaei TaxID=626935 RepID=UPI001F38616A|nr:triphosphoribosyl-dephospho-CoA synthase [Collinsella tanakaei]MCF2622523.1 triphosphoribosyl-dephospho-CoA synthase [Collinsella tanakaei]MDM8302743.1 triphosphoribosyl-dephospho-CoA synthase [Collinsella tanakaei]
MAFTDDSPSPSATATYIASLARASLVAEARLTPKPGLVDAVSNGAHTDMDITTFLASARALEPLFVEYVEAGMVCGDATPSELAAEMRAIGIRAEAAMFAATDGVNTHKGANFTFALILGATGALVSRGHVLPFAPEDTTAMFRLVARMAEGLLDHDVRELRQRTQAGDTNLTHGERLLLERGMQGVRGEAAQGYPLLRSTVLPYLHEAEPRIAQAASAREELLRCLVKIMAVLEDTNVVHRGGPDALVDHRAYCHRLDAAALPYTQLIDALAAYDETLTRRNVSPGGAADLLSLGIFLGLLEGLFGVDALAYETAPTEIY